MAGEPSHLVKINVVLWPRCVEFAQLAMRQAGEQVVERWLGRQTAQDCMPHGSAFQEYG